MSDGMTIIVNAKAQDVTPVSVKIQDRSCVKATMPSWLHLHICQCNKPSHTVWRHVGADQRQIPYRRWI